MRYKTIKDEIESMSTAKLERLLTSMTPPQGDPDYIETVKSELRRRKRDKEADYSSSWFV